MSENTHTLAQKLVARFGDRIVALTEAHGETTIEVGAQHLIDLARGLRDEKDFAFEQLVDLAGIDYLGYGEAEWDTSEVSSGGFSRGVEGAGPGRFTWGERPRADAAGRFAMVAHLLSLANNQRLRLRCRAPDAALPVVPSLTPVWIGATWFEREAFDLFGIVFEGHPDLRRILTDYGFVGHPFRKDFPLVGNVEVRYDPAKGRVVYEPVSIEPRVLVPRVVREDSRWQQGRAEARDQGS